MILKHLCFFKPVERKEESFANNSSHETRPSVTEQIPPPESNSFTASARRVREFGSAGTGTELGSSRVSREIGFCILLGFPELPLRISFHFGKDAALVAVEVQHRGGYLYDTMPLLDSYFLKQILVFTRKLDLLLSVLRQLMLTSYQQLFHQRVLLRYQSWIWHPGLKHHLPNLFMQWHNVTAQ